MEILIIVSAAVVFWTAVRDPRPRYVRAPGMRAKGNALRW